MLDTLLAEPDNPELALLRTQELKRLDQLMIDVLSPRECLAIRWHYGLGAEAKTLAEIGERFGVQRERVRQIEARGIRRLRFKLNPRRAADLQRAKEQRERLWREARWAAIDAEKQRAAPPQQHDFHMRFWEEQQRVDALAQLADAYYHRPQLGARLGLVFYKPKAKEAVHG